MNVVVYYDYSNYMYRGKWEVFVNNLMQFIIKILLITNSLILLFVIYFLSNKIWLFKYEYLSILLYINIPLILTAFCIRLCDFFTGDSIEGNIMSVELVNI